MDNLEKLESMIEDNEETLFVLKTKKRFYERKKINAKDKELPLIEQAIAPIKNNIDETEEFIDFLESIRPDYE